jgi:hypothetical protein
MNYEIWIMKILNLTVGSLCVISVLLSSCTELDTPYSLSKHGNIRDTVLELDTVKAVKKVLLEDYTGHKCTNCPEAAITARTMEIFYKGKLLLMAVHAGYYAKPANIGEYTLDLRCQEGDSWDEDFGINSNNPNGMVNRKVFNGNHVVAPDNWSSSVNSLISLAPDAKMKIFPTIDTITLTVKPVIYCQFLNKLEGAYRITVCVLENGILGTQSNNNASIGPVPDWPDYVFDDVLRGTINGATGEVLTYDVNTDLTYIGNFTYSLNADWDFHNCYILAYIYNAETLEIVQVEKVKILN